MKRLICLLFVIILMLTATGCSTVESIEDSDDSMFVQVEFGNLHGYTYSILYHKETKVIYAVSNKSVFTVMVDAEGKPLLWED